MTEINRVAATPAQLAAETVAREAADTAETGAREAADALLIPLAQRAAANGVATLGADSKLTGSQLPALAITDTFVAASQAAMLALAAHTGDVCVRTDLSESFILAGSDPTVLSNWVHLLSPPDAVMSVAGKVGTVVLVEGDVTGLVADLAARVVVAGDIGGTASAPTVVGLHLAGDTAVGHKLTAVTDPTGAQDAATKNYVDAVGVAVAAARDPILIPTAVKTGNYAAAPSDFVPVDTTASAVTVTLPASPADDTRIGVKIVVLGAGHAVTIACSGADVFNRAGGGTTLSLSLLNHGMLLRYKASAAIWYVDSDDLSLAQLDARYVASVFGRGGAVVAAAGDYAAAQVTNAADKASASVQAFAAGITVPAGKTVKADTGTAAVEIGALGPAGQAGVKWATESGGVGVIFRGAAFVLDTQDDIRPDSDLDAKLGGSGRRFNNLRVQYIQMGAATDLGAALNVTSNSSSESPVKVRGANGQTADLVQWIDTVSSNTPVAGVRASGLVYAKGAQVNPIVSGSLPTVSPSSGTAFQCSTSRDVFLVVPVTYSLVASTCKVEVSPDGVTYSTLATVDPGAAGAVTTVSVQVPAGWWVKLTVTNATLGTGTYY